MKTKKHAIELSRPGWAQVVLVCRDCRKRRNGPAAMKGKAVLAGLRQALRHSKPRPRVVSTSCLGPCPKGALTIAFVAGAGSPRHVEVGSLQQLATAAGLLAAAGLRDGKAAKQPLASTTTEDLAAPPDASSRHR